ncbi:hypothetical protein R1flu_023940 [Riccia fluitans]|uniref:Uncharacterized protein n=1 Tax=Riccia fluitans TaxID=41844 RepID=A0ABD1XTF9_9MARC
MKEGSDDEAGTVAMPVHPKEGGAQEQDRPNEPGVEVGDNALTGGVLPDLNKTPSNREVVIERNRLEKQNKKEKKRNKNEKPGGEG